MLMKDSSFVKRISDNTNRFRSQMTKAGFTISGDNHPISPGLFKTFCVCVLYLILCILMLNSNVKVNVRDFSL